MSPRWHLFAALIFATVAVSAHAETITITIDKMAFATLETHAKVGDTIAWVNKDAFVHTATARNGDWDVTIPIKKTATVVLKKAGAIDYYCRFHPNMKGKIIVDAQ